MFTYYSRFEECGGHFAKRTVVVSNMSVTSYLSLSVCNEKFECQCDDKIMVKGFCRVSTNLSPDKGELWLDKI